MCSLVHTKPHDWRFPSILKIEYLVVLTHTTQLFGLLSFVCADCNNYYPMSLDIISLYKLTLYKLLSVSPNLSNFRCELKKRKFNKSFPTTDNVKLKRDRRRAQMSESLIAKCQQLSCCAAAEELIEHRRTGSDP